MDSNMKLYFRGEAISEIKRVKSMSILEKTTNHRTIESLANMVIVLTEGLIKDKEMDIKLLAMKLYDAYCEAVGGLAFNGDKLPVSEEFFADESKQKQIDGWMAVAGHAYTEVTNANL